MPTRPSSLGVCGIVLITFGAIGLISLISSVMMISGGFNLPGAERNPALAAMKLPGYVLFMKVMIVPALLASLLGIVAGIGMLQGRPGLGGVEDRQRSGGRVGISHFCRADDCQNDVASRYET